MKPLMMTTGALILFAALAFAAPTPSPQRPSAEAASCQAQVQTLVSYIEQLQAVRTQLEYRVVQQQAELERLKQSQPSPKEKK
jgi:hypothetical protein